MLSEATAIEVTRSEAPGGGTLSREKLVRRNAHRRAANDISAQEIDLKNNALLERPLTLGGVKSRLLGRWSTTTTPLDMCAV